MREIDELVDQLLIYIQAQNIWIKDCINTYITFLDETECMFQKIQLKKPNIKNEKIQKVIYANASVMFIWKLLALDEDANNVHFSLTYAVVCKFALHPFLITAKMLLTAENHILDCYFHAVETVHPIKKRKYCFSLICVKEKQKTKSME